MKIKKSPYDILVNVICTLLLLGIVVYLAVNWQDIPDKIAGHYNAMGAVDRWGSKSELIVLPIIAGIMYAGMTAIEHFPQIWNTGITVTEENREAVYRILKNMIVTIKLLVVGVFVYLTVNSALETNLPIWFLPVFLVLTFGSLIFFIRKLIKVK